MLSLRVISEDDLLRFMREEEATKALHSFEGGFETKKITKQALKNWVVSLSTTSTALACASFSFSQGSATSRPCNH